MIKNKRVHYKDRIGLKFNRLTILDYIGNNKFYCQCECGNTKEIKASSVILGEIKSCGCLERELKSKRSLGNKYSATHNRSKTRLYQIWLDMKQRCYNKELKCYKWYGLKGIKVCDEWRNDYIEFEKWALDNNYSDTLTLDRIDSNCDYEPKNCRFITMREQSRNKCNTILITLNGKTQCLKDWCEELNLNYSTIKGRIKNGWGYENALFKPIDVRKKVLKEMLENASK